MPSVEDMANQEKDDKRLAFKLLRLTHRLSQQQVARTMFVRPLTIKKYESGTQNISDPVLSRAAELLKCTPEHMVEKAMEVAAVRIGTVPANNRVKLLQEAIADLESVINSTESKPKRIGPLEAYGEKFHTNPDFNSAIAYIKGKKNVSDIVQAEAGLLVREFFSSHRAKSKDGIHAEIEWAHSRAGETQDRLVCDANYLYAAALQHVLDKKKGVIKGKGV